jgi:hypothetical protein
VDRVHLVPGTLPADPVGNTHDLRNWYMSDALYKRLDEARTRRYPKNSTMSFALWLLDTALREYELQERQVARTSWDKIAAARLLDKPPANRIIVRDE